MSPETECGLDLEEARDQRRRFRRKPKRARDCRWESPRRALPKRGESLPPLPFPAGRRCLDRKQLRGRHTPWQISEEAGSSRPSEAEAGWTARSTAIRQRHQRRHRREKLYQRQNCRIQSVLPPGTDLRIRHRRRHGGLLERLLHDLPPHLLTRRYISLLSSRWDSIFKTAATMRAAKRETPFPSMDHGRNQDTQQHPHTVHTRTVQTGYHLGETRHDAILDGKVLGVSLEKGAMYRHQPRCLQNEHCSQNA